ncbi:MAG: hypothetical protein A2Y76_01995 [Planctomycetes bacterium RBG_13_60_9]|nr:MAG: hypothetical protein A2Y76_01995 [Planctomycetes bacterium RBG_13_60_9]
MLYILGVCALLAAIGIFSLCVSRWCEVDSRHKALLQAPNAVQKFTEKAGERTQGDASQTSPLVAQAQAYAQLLNPPRITEGLSVPVQPASLAAVMPPVRPATASANFKVYGTSYYPNEPGRSMALISEPGVASGQERWVKEGTQIGHFVIHEIRRVLIVYRDVETQNLASVREMAVERRMSRTSLVRGVQEGSLKVSAAGGDLGKAQGHVKKRLRASPQTGLLPLAG